MLGGVFIFAEASTILLSALAGRDARILPVALRSQVPQAHQKRPFWSETACCEIGTLSENIVSLLNSLFASKGDIAVHIIKAGAALSGIDLFLLVAA
jgi:DUF1680 family protein